MMTKARIENISPISLDCGHRGRSPGRLLVALILVACLSGSSKASNPLSWYCVCEKCEPGIGLKYSVVPLSEGCDESSGQKKVGLHKGKTDGLAHDAAESDARSKQDAAKGAGLSNRNGKDVFGVPALDIDPFRGAVMVSDIPIASEMSKGPSFIFRMKYNSRDLQGVSPLGWRWTHDYIRTVSRSNESYQLCGPAGQGPKFILSGTNFTPVEVADDPAALGSYGKYRLVYQNLTNTTNIVAYRRTWDSMECESGISCGSCGSGQSKATTPQIKPLYSPWHANEGFTFEPVPGSSNSYRLAKATGKDGYDLNVYYDSNNCITSVVTALSNTFLFSYSTNTIGYWNLTNIHDVAGNRNASFAYSNGCSMFLSSATDMAGQTFLYNYCTNNGLLTSLARPRAGGGYDTTLIGYGSGGLGGVEAFSYETLDEWFITRTYPDGKVGTVRWTGTVMRDGLDGLTNVDSAASWAGSQYSWSLFPHEKTPCRYEDALRRATDFEFYDYTNSAIMGLGKLKTNPDGTSEEWTYDANGNMTGHAKLDANDGLVSTSQWQYVYFPVTNYCCPSAVTNEVKDGNGTVINRSATLYTRYDRGTAADLTDDIYVLSSEKEWISPDVYSEVRYLYDTNTWLLTNVEQLVSTPGTYMTTRRFTYDGSRRVVTTADAQTNTTHLSYDSIGRVSRVVYSNTLARTTLYAYDSLNRMTNLVHPDGVSESWTYDDCGCGTATHVDREGNVTRYTHNENKWLGEKVIETPANTDIVHEYYYYDSAGNVTNKEDELNQNHYSHYNGANELAAVYDALNRQTQYTYGQNRQSALIIYPNGTAITNIYDSAGRMTSTEWHTSSSCTSLVRSVSYGYDGLGRRVTDTDSLGNVTSNRFDMLGRVVQTTYPDGSCTTNQYDLLGNLIVQAGPVPVGTAAGSAAFLAAMTTNTYDSLNRLTKTVDPAGRTNRWEYDPIWPNKVKYEANNNSVTNQESYYAAYTGLLLTNIVNGFKTTNFYDQGGTLVKVGYVDWTYTTNKYDGPRLMSQRSRAGITTSFGYDALGRRTVLTNSMGRVTHYYYDAVGNVTNVTDALTNKIFFTFDSMNRLTITTLPDGRASTNEYDALGRLISRTGAGSVPVYYAYDTEGRLTNITDGANSRTGLEYDSMGRLTRKTYMDGTFCAYTYSARGWLTNRLDGANQVTRYAYNNAGQLTNTDYLADTDVWWAYDKIGRMTGRVDAAGSWGWTYDGQSARPLTEKLMNGATTVSTVTYTYSTTVCDRTSVYLNTSNNVTYSWSQGRITAITNTLQGRFYYTYKTSSDLISQIQYRNGASTVSTYRVFDPLDRLTCVTTTNSAGVRLNSFTYTLDAAGRRTSRADGDGSRTDWAYDSLDQLISAARTNGPNSAADAAYDFVFEYDEVGNRLSEHRGQTAILGEFNPLNQLTHSAWTGRLDAVGSVATNSATVKVGGQTATLHNGTNYLGGIRLKAGSNTISVVAKTGTTNYNEELATVYAPPTNPQEFLYDANGNLTNDGYCTYAWDNENRLATVESVSSVGKFRSEYVYDGQSRRVKTTDCTGWNGSVYATTNVTKFVWDGWMILAELTSANVITNFYVWGPDLSGTVGGAGGIGGLLGTRSGPGGASGTLRLYTCDGNGNVADVLHSAGTNVIAHYEYDPYGRIVFQSGSYAAGNRIRFSTKWFDPQSRLYYYGRRFLQVQTGRWLSRDPIEEQGGIGLYVFCGNEPVGTWDALGEQVFAPATTRELVLDAIQNLIEAAGEQWQEQRDKAAELKGEFGWYYVARGQDTRITSLQEFGAPSWVLDLPMGGPIGECNQSAAGRTEMYFDVESARRSLLAWNPVGEMQVSEYGVQERVHNRLAFWREPTYELRRRRQFSQEFQGLAATYATFARYEAVCSCTESGWKWLQSGNVMRQEVLLYLTDFVTTFWRVYQANRAPDKA